MLIDTFIVYFAIAGSVNFYTTAMQPGRLSVKQFKTRFADKQQLIIEGRTFQREGDTMREIK